MGPRPGASSELNPEPKAATLSQSENMPRMSPLQENTAIHRHAKAAGLEYVRDYRAITITDMAALRAAGFTVKKEVADRGRIAEALDAGLEVPGASMGGMEYVLRGRE